VINGRIDDDVRILGNSMYRHNTESFQKMWDEVGESTGTKWTVESEMLEPGVRFKGERSIDHDPRMKRIRFSVVRE
jgi:hypothetical protein